MAPRDFFVRLVMMYKCTDFHPSRTICMAGLLFQNIQGGAREALSHGVHENHNIRSTSDAEQAYQMWKSSEQKKWVKISLILIAPPIASPLAKFHQFWSIDSQWHSVHMWEVWCKSVHVFMRYSFFIIIAPPRGKRPLNLIPSLIGLWGTEV